MTRSPYGSIRRLPSGQYQARLRMGAGQLSLGTFMTRRLAAETIARVAARGTAAKPARGGGQSLGEFAEAWLVTRAGHRLSTQRRDRLVLNSDVLPVFGTMALADIAPADIQAWVSAQSARLAPATVRRSHTVLAQLLNAAVDEGVLEASPAARVRLPRLSRTEMRFLTPSELERLADAIDGRWRAMVLVMAWATLRMGEAAGLRRGDVDVAAGSLRVTNNLVEVGGKLIEGPPKSAAGRRTMTLPASVMAELADHLGREDASGYVFCGPRGGRLRPSSWRPVIWRPAVEAAGLAPLRPHDLKHSGVAFLAAAEVDPSEIARRAGHASVAFTYDHYGHLLPEVDKQAAAKLERLRDQAKG